MSDPETDQRLRHIESELDGLTGQARLVLGEAQVHSSAINALRTEVQGQLDAVKADQQRTNSKVDSLHQDLTQFIERDRREKEKLFAHAGLLTVRSEIERKYGQYEVVRRNVHGMLQALDGGLAQDATMQLIAETQTINAPSYWLASAQNALAAWIRDDQSAAERALVRASSCSRAKTALFFGLINARFERFEATEGWFREYMADQDPAALSSEFIVVLDAAMLGLLGDSTYEQVNRQCKFWFEHLRTREDIVARQVTRWRAVIRTLRDPASGLAETALNRQCRVLAGICPDWRQITASYADATAFIPMKRALSGRLNAPRADQSAWQHRIDDTLRELQSLHEPEEADLRSEETQLQRILSYDGNTLAAEMAREAEAPLEEPRVDLLTFFSNVASRPRVDGPPETTQLAIYHASDWIRSATAEIVDQARELSAAPIRIRIGGWDGQLGAEPTDTLAGSFAKMIDDQTREAEASARFAWPRLLAGLATVAFLVIIGVVPSAHSMSQPWPMGILAILALVFLLITVRAHLRIPQQIRAAKQRGEQRKKAGLATLQVAEHDRRQLLNACEERIAEAGLLDQFLESVALPERRRGVPGQEPGRRMPPTAPNAGAAVTSSRPHGSSRLPSWLKLPEWSLEPGGASPR